MAKRRRWLVGAPILLALGAVVFVEAGGADVDVKGKFQREVVALGLPQGPGPETVVSAEEIASLSPVVQRYLGYMKVVGMPRVWSFRCTWEGGFRMKPDQAFQPIRAYQYSTRLAHARLFYMSLAFAGIPVMGRDSYLDGRGRLLIRPLDLFTLEDSRDEKLAIGELVTYLNDGILFAPSILLGPETTWSQVDERSFDVALTDGGRTVKGRVFVDERGAPVDFETTDRFGKDPFAGGKEYVRGRWSTPVSGWREVEGRPQPVTGKAIWHFPGGDFTYGEMGCVPGSVAFNVPPGA